MLLTKDTLHPALITTPESASKIFVEHRVKHGNVPLIAASGAFDPLHYGHIRYIQSSALLKGPSGLLLVIVNSDEFLIRKKGYVFMPLQERIELIASLRGVDIVVPCIDDSDVVSDTLKTINPNIFAKGGERYTTAASNVPEYDMCQQINCAVVFGIGGTEQLQSSSQLVQKMQKPQLKNSELDSVQQGIKDARAGRIESCGSFIKYIDD